MSFRLNTGTVIVTGSAAKLTVIRFTHRKSYRFDSSLYWDQASVAFAHLMDLNGVTCLFPLLTVSCNFNYTIGIDHAH